MLLLLPLLVGCDGGKNGPAQEVCDGVDNDGDGLVDDDDPDAATVDWFADIDGDTFGDPATKQVSCQQPSGYVADNTDCNDQSADDRPNNIEVCDGFDNDCDGLVDDADDSCSGMEAWYADADRDGYGDPESMKEACDQPWHAVKNNNDCDDSAYYVHPRASEFCNGIDDDCDGKIDDDDPDLGNGGNGISWSADADGDGYGDRGDTTEACIAPPGKIQDMSDCDDSNPAVHPDATEVCNDTDDDCDGLVDGQDDSLTGSPDWYLDYDGDGFGDVNVSQTACNGPAGTVTNHSDCNDGNPDAHPGGTEVCNNRDDDCDGLTDGGDDSLVGSSYYPDLDGDGYGDATSPTMACSTPPNYVSDSADCDDSDGALYPGAAELCDGIDNDCDGLVDGLCLGLLSLLTGEHVGVVTTQSLLALIYLFTFGSIIGFTAYGYLLSHASLPVATSYAYVNPLVAVLLGVGFGGEELDAQSVVGLVTLVLAVVLVT